MRRVFSGLSCMLASLLLLLGASLAPAHADLAVPALSLDQTTALTLNNPPFTLGWRFTVTSPIEVTALGVFDSDLNGLTDSYQVGIWNSTSTLVISTTVSSGTTDPLVNQFRYHTLVTPVTLNPGIYDIGALYSTNHDGLIVSGDIVTGFSVNSTITFGGDRFFSGSSLTDPTSSIGGGPGQFGPNFLIAQVPEPAAVALLGGALLGLALLRRRRPRAS